MENASKFIQIAGGILIAMIVVTLLVIGFRQMSGMQLANEEATKEYQLGEFNKKFESYNKSVVRGYEIVSLTNMALDNNVRNTEADGYIPIKIWVSIRGQTESAVANMPGADGTNDKEKLTPVMHNGKKYYNMNTYMTDYYSVLEEIGENKSNAESKRNEFKMKYFQCVELVYDTTPKSGSGRITNLYFDEIKELENS